MREVIIKIRDDLDGADADETISFAYRGTSYEIDLSSANVEVFDKSMGPFLKAAREVVPVKDTADRSPRPATAQRVAKAALEQRKRIRAWANSSGFTVDERGMISSVVVEAYRVAHPDEKFHPDTVPPRKNLRAATSVTAQELRALSDEDGLISATALLKQQKTRDRHGEELTKAQRTRIREWAKENGLDQAAVGHIKREVKEAYYAAHPEEG